MSLAPYAGPYASPLCVPLCVLLMRALPYARLMLMRAHLKSRVDGFVANVATG